MFSEKYILTEDDYQEFPETLWKPFRNWKRSTDHHPEKKNRGICFRRFGIRQRELNPGEGDCFGD